MTELEFTLTKRQTYLMLPFLFLIAIPQLLLGHYLFAVVYLVVIAIPTPMRAKSGVTLTPEGILLRGFKRQLVPWQQIRWIEVYSPLGTSVVRLHRFEGRKKTMRAPLTGFLQKDPEFGAKVNTIFQWWFHYTGQVQPQYQWPVPPQPYLPPMPQLPPQEQQAWGMQPQQPVEPPNA